MTIDLFAVQVRYSADQPWKIYSFPHTDLGIAMDMKRGAELKPLPDGADRSRYKAEARVVKVKLPAFIVE